MLAAATAVSAGLDILGGAFSYLAGDAAAEVAEQRARVLRLEAEADAQRFAEQAQDFKARQKLAYLKSGVDLSGSPLDVLDESARVARENLSAMRARGEAEATDVEQQGLYARMQGRAALVGGIFGAAKTGIRGAYEAQRNAETARTPRNNTRTR